MIADVHTCYLTSAYRAGVGGEEVVGGTFAYSAHRTGAGRLHSVRPALPPLCDSSRSFLLFEEFFIQIFSKLAY